MGCITSCILQVQSRGLEIRKRNYTNYNNYQQFLLHAYILSNHRSSWSLILIKLRKLASKSDRDVFYLGDRESGSVIKHRSSNYPRSNASQRTMIHSGGPASIELCDVTHRYLLSKLRMECCSVLFTTYNNQQKGLTFLLRNVTNQFPLTTSSVVEISLCPPSCIKQIHHLCSQNDGGKTL